jgi:hypothetical protein
VIPKPGDILRVGRAASVQFGQPILFRVIRVEPWPTYYGWLWLSGYQLDHRGEAVEQRSIFVQHAGLRVVNLTPPTRRTTPPTTAVRRPNAGPRTGGRPSGGNQR